MLAEERMNGILVSEDHQAIQFKPDWKLSGRTEKTSKLFEFP